MGTRRVWRHLEHMSRPTNGPQNRLLLALPSSNLKRLMTQLEQIPCQHGQILLDADSSLDDVFFQIVASYLSWRFMRTAVLSKWRRLAERVAQDSKPSSGRKSPLCDCLSKFRGAHQNCLAPRLPGPCSRCHLSEISCPLTFMLSSNRCSSL
jgi:hypothetical protein